MAANKKFRFGPLALTNTLTTNLLNPPTVTGGVNAVSLWLGATGANTAGTEVIGVGTTIAANSAYDWYSPGLRIDSTDFLVGGASANTSLTIQGEGEIGVSG